MKSSGSVLQQIIPGTSNSYGIQTIYPKFHWISSQNHDKNKKKPTINRWRTWKKSNNKLSLILNIYVEFKIFNPSICKVSFWTFDTNKNTAVY